MGRPPRFNGELTSIKFTMLLAPSEYLELRDAAEREGESMAEYMRRATAFRFEWQRHNRIKFGARFRVDQAQ